MMMNGYFKNLKPSSRQRNCRLIGIQLFRAVLWYAVNWAMLLGQEEFPAQTNR